LTDHQFRETLEVTDRCYVIREGRVFAYGNREQILANPDVRRYYIGERFDVGHLADRRRPPGISQSQPPADSLSDDGQNVRGHLPALPGEFMTTHVVHGQAGELSIETTQTDAFLSDADEDDPAPGYMYRVDDEY